MNKTSARECVEARRNFFEELLKKLESMNENSLHSNVKKPVTAGSLKGYQKGYKKVVEDNAKSLESLFSKGKAPTHRQVASYCNKRNAERRALVARTEKLLREQGNKEAEISL